MATLLERVVANEERLRDHERRIEQIEDNYNGGGGVEYIRSVRGRLHTIEGAQAAMAIITKNRVRVFKGWQAGVVTFAALVTAVAALVSALHVIFS